MAVKYSEQSKEFHLFNGQISYILQILPNGAVGNLYFGKRIRHKEDFSYLLEGGAVLLRFIQRSGIIFSVHSTAGWNTPAWEPETSESLLLS